MHNMGCSSGTQIAEDLWNLVGKYITDNKKKRVARKFIAIFENADCDTIDEWKKLIKEAQVEYNFED